MKIVIYVAGGTVQEVRCDGKEPVEVEVFDVDNKQAEGVSKKTINRHWKEIENACPRVML